MLHRLAELDADRARGLRRFRLCARRRGAVGVHERRSLGVLFRHPQGRALLRRALEREAARRAGVDRAHLPRRDASGWRRSSSSPARRRGRRATPARAPSISSSFRSSPAAWRDDALAGEMGDDPPRPFGRHRRDRDRARDKAIGSSLEASPRVYVERCGAARGARRRRFRRSVHHLRASRSNAARARPEGAFRLGETPGVAVVVERAAGRQMRALLALFRSGDRRSRLSRRHPARRRGVARTRTPRGGPDAGARRSAAWRSSGVLALDQASKLAVVRYFDATAARRSPLTPFLDFTLRWNRGISFSLFAQESAAGRWLLLALTLAVTALLGVLAVARARASGRPRPRR